jgi:[ribosomal protein S18]-alanine N-acetyltransferase
VPFRLRAYDPADFQRLYEIDRLCFPPGISYSRQELAYYMNLRGAFTIVAETTGKTPEIAGFIVAQKRPKGIGHIVTIDTLYNFRRTGLGTTLIKAAEDRLRTEGCYGVVLETAVDNEGAIAFYKKLDYFIIKTIPRYYKDRLDAFMMGKRIAEPSPAPATQVTNRP